MGRIRENRDRGMDGTGTGLDVQGGEGLGDKMRICGRNVKNRLYKGEKETEEE